MKQMSKIIVVGILLLFLGSCITPVIAQHMKDFHSTSKGNWLYVGGSGPGNYTRIRDAVENASDGDTVFVYDDSSPYIEWFNIAHSISLIGESRNTTIIKGSLSGAYLIHILAPHVSVREFSLLNNQGSGIFIESDNATITDTIISGMRSAGITCRNSNDTNISHNIITDCVSGVLSYSGDVTYGNINRNIIANNVIRYTVEEGISIWGDHIVIHGNNIAPADSTIDGMREIAIDLGGAYNNVSYNTISSLKTGINLHHSYKTLFYRNNFTNNQQFGLLISGGSGDSVLENNFMNNTKNMKIINPYFNTILIHNAFNYPLLPRPIRIARNFWDEPRSMPYPVFSLFLLTSIVVSYLYLFFGDSFVSKLVNFVRFDWHPAQHPYDIPRIAI